MNIKKNGAKTPSVCQLFNCPHMDTRLAVYRAAFPSTHEITAKRNERIARGVHVRFWRTISPVQRGVRESDPDCFRISCHR